jgi:hypothetical protein
MKLHLLFRQILNVIFFETIVNDSNEDKIYNENRLCSGLTFLEMGLYASTLQGEKVNLSYT